MVLCIKTISSEELGWPAVWKNVVQPDVTFPVSRSSTASQLCLFHVTNTLLPTHLLFIYFTSPPRQVAACLSTNPLNWAVWMLSCTWRVRFLMKALFYCSLRFTISLWSWRNVNERKNTTSKTRRLWRSTHVAKAWKKNFIFWFVLFVFWGNSKTYIYPFGCREMCSSRWSCMKSRRKSVLGNVQHRNHKKQ